jgi:hypothetical protein
VNSSVERHAALVAAGWRCRLDGLWRPPATDDDQRAHTFNAAWRTHVERSTETSRLSDAAGS